MSTLPDNEFDLDKLFLPAWAQEPSAAKYAKYEGETEDKAGWRKDRRGPRPPRREGAPEGRREGGFGRGPRPGGRRPEGGGQGRPPGGGRPQQQRRYEPAPRREPPPPLPQVDATVLPEEKGVELLARQIKMTGRAYPLFDIAHLILQKPERHAVSFAVKKDAEGKVIVPLYLCALDDSLWLCEDEAVAHVLRKHFATFYQTEKTATEPPKGKYTFVAQCGMSGTILGPPNHHDYQNHLRKLHSERFSRMPFEVFKSRVKIVRDEEVVKKWVDDQSWKTEFICLNQPEPLRLPDMDAVEKHFREIHKDTIIKQVESHRMDGAAARSLRSQELARLARTVLEDQRRFPLQLATVLSQQFANYGLQFFKVNRAVTHVCVARPHYLDLAAAPVSDGVRKIVEFINATPKCSRRVLVEALAPTPPAAPISVGAEQQVAAPATPEPTPEQTAVISDLHWLVHQGHVIEFANGTLETAKKPLPKPPKPEPKPKEKKPAAEPAAAAADATQAPANGEAPPAASSENPQEVQETVPTGEAPDLSGESQPAAAPAEEAASETAPADAAQATEPVPAPAEESAPASIEEEKGKTAPQSPPA